MRVYLTIILLWVSLGIACSDAIEVLEKLPGDGKKRVGNSLVRLARRSVEHYLENKTYLPLSRGLPPVLMQQGSVFVTITRKGKPRGCMGSLQPHTSSLAEELILMAVQAATRDSRVRPLKAEDLSQIKFAVSLVGKVKQVIGPESLNPRQYGLLVASGRRSGVLLPGEARTVSWQIQECHRRAGVRPGGNARMYRFETLRFDEK